LIFEEVSSENNWKKLKNSFISFYKMPEHVIPPLMPNKESKFFYIFIQNKRFI